MDNKEVVKLKVCVLRGMKCGEGQSTNLWYEQFLTETAEVWNSGEELPESLKVQADPGSQFHLKTWNSVIHINVECSAVQCILLCIPNHFLELCSMGKQSHKKRCLMTSLMSEQGIVTRLSERDPFKVFADNLGTTQLLNPNLTASASRLSIFPTCKTESIKQIYMTWITQQQQFFCKEVYWGRYWSKYFLNSNHALPFTIAETERLMRKIETIMLQTQQC